MFQLWSGGSYQARVPPKKNENCQFMLCTRPTEMRVESQDREQTITVILNKKMVLALIRTSSTQTLVQSSLVQREWQSKSPGLRIRCIHGEEKEYPTAEVYLEVQGQNGI